MWRSTESMLLEVQCEVSEVSDDFRMIVLTLDLIIHNGPTPADVTSAGVGPLCIIKSKVNAAICQKILEHFMIPSADKLYEDARKR